MQPVSCIFFLILSYIPFVSSTVTLKVDPTTGVSVPTKVDWTRDGRDPRDFDLRFVRDGVDMGLATEVHSEKGQHHGMTSVQFLDQGTFELKAIDYSNKDQIIGTSQKIIVDYSSSTTSTGEPPLTTTSSEPTEASTTEASTTEASTTVASTTTETSAPWPTTMSSQQHTNTSSPTKGSSKQPSHVPVIVGGIIGGLACLGLLIAIIVLLLRQRDKKAIRRYTFHRDLMVQSRRDLEHGNSTSRSPLPSSMRQPVSIPTPIVPTRSRFPDPTIAMPSPHIPPTERQVLLDKRVDELEQRLDRIRRQNRGQAGVETVLEQIRHQMQWLESQRNSPWARFETDVPPPGLDLYWE